MDLVPPSLSTGTEISLSPCAKGDLSIDVVAVGKSKGEWCRSTDNGSGGGVLFVAGKKQIRVSEMRIEYIGQVRNDKYGLTHLRSVAWAHEFVVGGRPWDDASQVCADSVKSVALDGLVFLDDDVTVDGKRVELFGMVLVVHH